MHLCYLLLHTYFLLGWGSRVCIQWVKKGQPVSWCSKNYWCVIFYCRHISCRSEYLRLYTIQGIKEGDQLVMSAAVDSFCRRCFNAFSKKKTWQSSLKLIVVTYTFIFTNMGHFIHYGTLDGVILLLISMLSQLILNNMTLDRSILFFFNLNAFAAYSK